MSQIISQETMNFFAAQHPTELQAMKDFIIELQVHQASSPHTQHVKSPMRKRPRSAAAQRSRNSKPNVKTTGAIVAAKRPLNSWMAFRSYYSPIFATFQQKDISGFMTLMWNADPFHAKWTIVAKAYSVIRDKVGKNQARLDLFNRTVCELVGKLCLISPNDYLSKLGWYMNEDRVLVRAFAPNLAAFTAEERSTTMSVDDLVKYCYDTGYVVGVIQPAEMAGHASLTMAAQPTDSGLHENVLDQTSFVSIDPEEPASEQEVASVVSYEANNVLLETSCDMYPYNQQFDSDDAAAGYGLYFDANDGDQFASFDASLPIDFQQYLNNDYDHELDQLMKELTQ